MGESLSPQDCDYWWDAYIEIAEAQDRECFALSDQLDDFIRSTESLAQTAEGFGLDSTPLVRFLHDARLFYNKIQGDRLPVADEAVQVLIDRLKFKLQGHQPVVAMPLSAVSPPATANPQQSDQKRKPLPEDEANLLVRKYLEEHPQATIREVARDVDIATGRVSKLPAWRAEFGRRKANKEVAKKSTRPLTNKMLQSIGKGDDPAARLEAEETVWQRLLEEAAPNERANLHAMPREQRAKLVEAVREQYADRLPDEDE